MKKIADAYNEWASQYDTNKNRTRDLEKVAAQATLASLYFRNLIEIGCGTGKNTEWLVLQSQSITALDFSAEMLKMAKEKIRDPRVAFQFADLTKPWPVAEGAADAVVCSLVLEHIEDIDLVFGQAARSLEKGGKFYVCELHPFKQYAGTKARYPVDGVLVELEVYIHHISDYVSASQKAGFRIGELREWFDNDEPELPRLISFLFHK